MVIDFHVHAFPDEVARKAIPLLTGRAGIPAVLDGTVADVKQSMKEAGVDCSLLLPIATRPSQTPSINRWAASVRGKGILSFGSVHPEYEGWREELAWIRSAGLKGIKLHPDYQEFYVDEPALFPIYEEAVRLGLIVVFHAGVDIGLPEPCHCTPDRMVKVVRAFPEGKFVAAHMGGYRCWDAAEELLAGTAVYFDTSYSVWEMDRRQFERMLRKHDPSRILFATDSPWRTQAEELEMVRNLGLPPELTQSILGSNAAALLGFGENGIM